MSSTIEQLDLRTVLIGTDQFELQADGGDSYKTTLDDIATFIGAGTGDVVGPAASTEDAIARYTDATGKLIDTSLASINDAGVILTTGLDIIQNATPIGSPAAAVRLEANAVICFYSADNDPLNGIFTYTDSDEFIFIINNSNQLVITDSGTNFGNNTLSAITTITLNGGGGLNLNDSGISLASELELTEQGADPSVGTDAGILYTKDVTDSTHLFYRNTDGITDITAALAAGGGTSFIGFTADADLNMGAFNVVFSSSGSATSTSTMEIYRSGSELNINTDVGDAINIRLGGTTIASFGVGAVPSFNMVSASIQQAVGTPVASAGSMSLIRDGNYYHVTGTTTMNTISNAGWQNGSIIELYFEDIVTVTDAATGAGEIHLADNSDYTSAAGEVLTLILDAGDWVEISRSTVASGGSSNQILQGNTSITVTDTGSDGAADFVMDGTSIMTMDAVSTNMAQRFELAQGTATFVSSDKLIWPDDGNFILSGGTNGTLRRISNIGWQDGSIISVRFNAFSTNDITHDETVSGTDIPLYLLTRANYVDVGTDVVFTFMLDGNLWRELYNTFTPSGGGGLATDLSNIDAVTALSIALDLNTQNITDMGVINFVSKADPGNVTSISYATDTFLFHNPDNAGFEYWFGAEGTAKYTMDSNGLKMNGLPIYGANAIRGQFPTNGRKILDFTETATSVNWVNIKAGAAGNPAIISAEGETNSDLELSGNGSGAVALLSDLDMGGNDINLGNGDLLETNIISFGDASNTTQLNFNSGVITLGTSTVMDFVGNRIDNLLQIEYDMFTFTTNIDFNAGYLQHRTASAAFTLTTSNISEGQTVTLLIENTDASPITVDFPAGWKAMGDNTGVDDIDIPGDGACVIQLFASTSANSGIYAVFHTKAIG